MLEEHRDFRGAGTLSKDKKVHGRFGNSKQRSASSPSRNSYTDLQRQRVPKLLSHSQILLPKWRSKEVLLLVFELFVDFFLSFLFLAGTMLPFETRVLTGRVPIALLLFIDPVAENPAMNKNLQ